MRMSACCSVDATYSTLILRVLNRSWMKWKRTSKCLLLAELRGFSISALAPWLSQRRCSGFGHEKSTCSSDVAVLVIELPMPEEDLAMEAQTFVAKETGKRSVVVGEEVGGGELGEQVVQYITDSAATCNMTPYADGLTNSRECSQPQGLANGGITLPPPPPTHTWGRGRSGSGNGNGDGGEPRSAGLERGRERGRGGNGDGNGDGSEDSSGGGNGDEDNGNGNEYRIGEGGRKAKKRKKPQNSCRCHIGNGGDLCGKRKKSTKERVGPVAANPDNPESSKEAGGKHKVLRAQVRIVQVERVCPLGRV